MWFICPFLDQLCTGPASNSVWDTEACVKCCLPHTQLSHQGPSLTVTWRGHGWQGFCCQLVRGNSLDCLRISLGPFWSITQLDLAHFWYWKFHLVARNGQLGQCLPHYLYTSYYKKFPLHLTSLLPHVCPSILAVSPHILSLNLFSLLPTPDYPAHVQPQPPASVQP